MPSGPVAFPTDIDDICFLHMLCRATCIAHRLSYKEMNRYCRVLQNHEGGITTHTFPNCGKVLIKSISDVGEIIDIFAIRRKDRIRSNFLFVRKHLFSFFHSIDELLLFLLSSMVDVKYSLFVVRIFLVTVFRNFCMRPQSCCEPERLRFCVHNHVDA